MMWQKIRRLVHMSIPTRSTLENSKDTTANQDTVALPKLTDSEFQQYNRHAVKMNFFVSNSNENFVNWIVNKLFQA